MRKTQKRWLPQFGLCSFSFSIKYYPLQSNFLLPSLFPTFIWDFMMSPLFGVLFGAICHTFAPKHHSLLMQNVCRFSKKELFCNFLTLAFILSNVCQLYPCNPPPPCLHQCRLSWHFIRILYSQRHHHLLSVLHHRLYLDHRGILQSFLLMILL